VSAAPWPGAELTALARSTAPEAAAPPVSGPLLGRPVSGPLLGWPPGGPLLGWPPGAVAPGPACAGALVSAGALAAGWALGVVPVDTSGL
jgi:hypothetical protein